MEFILDVIFALLFVVSLCDAWSDPRIQKPASRWSLPQQMPSQRPSPPASESRRLAQDLQGVQSKQLSEGLVSPLVWRFPVTPEVQTDVAVGFEQRRPVTPRTVAVMCGESAVLVEVKQDLFGTGQLIRPSGLSLGGCPVFGADFGSKVLMFVYELHQCGSVLMMTENKLIYSFVLTYTPEPFMGTSISRAEGAVIGVQCHYQRKQDVSSNVLMPTWAPYSSMRVGQEVLPFSLKLMTDDWTYQRPSNLYYLGDLINIEASVKVYNHGPLRVFVDSCVASQTPDVRVLPTYSLIENNGCFVDARNTGSSSGFLPQSRSDVLHFQLEAFMFQQGEHPYIYITCVLRATLASAPGDARHKSCSFSGDRWFAATGNDQVCGCCESTCGPEMTNTGVQWEGQVSLSPLQVQERQKLGFQ
ncbi:Zona pellucida sperm-binding protein 3 [Triplophysa tibetana]|uniref:Zona pellucida sperm-binding protein 3 n=1 Tax=Triplophysa tibetana TaxID=1572043 RepID=A0A5A9NNT7_9TELE|nr:Zona pellucida sperm-binding protein 3 [Triplophysa tibetana]